MGKANKVKGEFLEVKESVELLQVLKDVADMRYHALAQEKGAFYRFGASFVEFFRLLKYTEVAHPLVSNDNENVVIIAVTTEEGFVGDLNSKIVNRTIEEMKKYPGAKVVTVGKKGVGKLKQAGIDSDKTFVDISGINHYELSVMIKDYVVENVMNGSIGRCLCIYPWPKEMGVVRARVVKLLPCEFIVQQQQEHQEQSIENFDRVIEESDPVDIIGFLADLWLSSKLYEIMFEMSLAAASAQTQQLETSVDKMKKESDVVKLRYRKARKTDIDTSLRETFVAKLMSGKS